MDKGKLLVGRTARLGPSGLTVHMHCVMCPPRGVYDKAIGRPLNEIYPDDKLREEQLRHMCTWHSGEVKRAYHPRGMFARGCTEGIVGRSDVGPSGFRTEHLGCSCGRRDRHGGVFDDATMQKMAAELAKKKRDPDTFMPASVCQRFGLPSTDALLSAEDKMKNALERARECQRRCNEYKKAQKEAEGGAASTRKSSRVGESQEGRLPKVTEGGEDTQTEVLDDGGPITEDETQAPENLSSSGRMSTKASTGTASTKLPHQPEGTSISSPEGTLYPQEAGTENLQGRLSPGTGSGRISANASKATLPGRSTPESGFERRSGASSQDKSPDAGSGKVSSKVSGASLQERSSPDPGSGKISSKASGTSSKTSQRQESAGASASTGRHSAGVTAQDGDPNKSKSPCSAITLQCRCSMFNKSASNVAYSKQCTPQAMGYSQYEQNQYGQQNMRYPQEQVGQYGQAQQYRTECLGAGHGSQTQQGQQCGAQNQPGQQYGAQNQQGQQYGAQNQQGQQYGAQNQQGQYGVQNQTQQYAIQGQQGQPYGLVVQYGNEAEQYGGMYQECLSQDQQYGAQGQQYTPQGQRYSTQVQQSGQYGPQSETQDQQYPPGQGAAGCPPCPPCGQASGQAQAPPQKSSAGSATAQSNRQCSGKSRNSPNPSCSSSNSRKRCSRHDSTNTYDGDEDEDSKSGCKDLL